jgi:hypothetical protein
MKTNIKLLLIFISIVGVSFALKSEDKPKTVFADRIDSMTKLLDNAPNWAGNPTPNGAVVSYDEEASNYKRFEESPCFDKLGFSPFRSPDEQERMYQSCESEYYKSLMIKIVSSVLIFGFIAYMIYISMKRKKLLSSTTKNQNDVEDK